MLGPRLMFFISSFSWNACVLKKRRASGCSDPATSPRLIAGLLYLQHAFDLSDEGMVWQWLENPYLQVFTGETYLQTKPPITRACDVVSREAYG